MLSVTFLYCYTMCLYAECSYTESLYVERSYTERLDAECNYHSSLIEGLHATKNTASDCLYAKLSYTEFLYSVCSLQSM
jgi:hypothetical protein